MYNPETDLIFPPRSLPAICELRGEEWRKLVDKVIQAGPESLDQMAFVLMMARMNNCVTCNANSYRAMTGCTTCTRQSLKRFHESDEALVAIYKDARVEVVQFIEKKTSTQKGDSSSHRQEFKGKYVK